MMKNLFRIKNALLSIMLLTFIVSCNKDDDKPAEMKQNIVETAQATDALSSLVAALLKADEGTNANLVGTLSGNGPFTVFAPTNAAFTTLLASLEGYNSLDDFNTPQKKELLATILTYHVVAGAAVKSTDLTNGQEITTFQTEKLGVALTGGNVYIKDGSDPDAKVVIADVEASNGIVHVIDKVLIPEAAITLLQEIAISEKTLVDVVVETASLSILEAAVIKADLATTLSGSGPFTVFAPTNDAFVALLNTLGDDYNSLDDFNTAAEIALLKNILLYHVLPLEVKATNLAAGPVATALTNNSLQVIASGSTFVIGDESTTNANITSTDILASNGVAHTIDKVLLPQEAIDFVERLTNGTLVEVVVATDPLSILEAAVIKTGLVDTLNSSGPFTVFAPTNDAFVALLNALGNDYNSLDDFNTDAEIDILRNILLYHVLPAEVKATDLAAGAVGTAFAGNNINVIASGNTFVIGDASTVDANITGTDILASNGVAHTIDKVLLPQLAIDFVEGISNGTLVDIVVATEPLSILEAAVIKANLVGTLNSTGPFTVFAPTNDAFVAMLDFLGPNYNSLDDFNTASEIAALKNILLYHVLFGKVTASDLATGSVETAFAGNNIEILASGNTFVIGDDTDVNAGITSTDIFATNGVAHTINKVLLPQAALTALGH